MSSVTDYILYFFLYSMMGWVGETIYCSVGDKKFVNRGFLTGPMCPIYGTGATVFSVCLMPFYNKYGYSKWYIILLVIFLGMILADIVEFLTSLIMEKLFNARWWDYSNKKFNIQGRICLGHTMYWGVATGLFIYVVHPFVTRTVEGVVMPAQRQQIVIMILLVFLVDLFFAVKGAFDVRKFMTKLNKINDSVTETAAHIKQELQNKRDDIYDTMEKGAFKAAVWIVDIRNQLSELEEHASGKRKKSRIQSNEERHFLSAKNLRKTVDRKIASIKEIIEEFSDPDFYDEKD